MNTKQFNKKVSNAKGIATLIFFIGWAVLFLIGLGGIASSPGDRIIGVIALMASAIIGYNTYKNWSTISKKIYHLTFNIPELQETYLNHWDSMYFLAKMMDLYHSGKIDTFEVKVRRLTEDEEKQVEETDEEE